MFVGYVLRDGEGSFADSAFRLTQVVAVAPKTGDFIVRLYVRSGGNPALLCSLTRARPQAKLDLIVPSDACVACEMSGAARGGERVGDSRGDVDRGHRALAQPLSQSASQNPKSEAVTPRNA